jgi:hypothetical protein
MQQEFVEFNQLNWNTHNDLTRLRVDLEWMMQNYAKMESNLEQQGIITSLEHTCQDFKEQ